jgi:hypothetical protein
VIRDFVLAIHAEPVMVCGMDYATHVMNEAAKQAAKWALIPVAVLARQLKEVDEEIEGLSDIVAEDANEAALFGDGPCGSADRAAEMRGLIQERRALWIAYAAACDYGPKLPEAVISEEEIPF